MGERRLQRGTRSLAFLAFSVLFLLLAAAPPATPGQDPPRPTDTTPPVADAGPDQTVDQGDLVQFSGTGSWDDVGIDNYTWIAKGPVGTPRTLFTLGTSGSAAAFDPARPLLYLLQSTMVEVVNLTNGAVDRSFPLSHTPQYEMTLAVSPGGSYLVVSIPTGTRGYYYFGPYDSFLATVDLVNQTKLGEFFLPQDAMSAAVSDDGLAAVSGGSGQWADLRLYNVRNGTAFPMESIVWQNNRIAMHPSGNRGYYVETGGLSSLEVGRFDINITEGITGTRQWPYFGSEPGGAIWVHDDLLVTGSGMVLALTADPSADMNYVYRLTQSPVADVAFGEALSLIAVATGSQVEFFAMDTYETLGTADLGGTPSALVFRGGDLLALVGNRIVTVRAPRLLLYGVSPTHVFADAGTYVVTLTCRDAAGNAGSDTMVVTVRDITAPVAAAGLDETVWQGDWVQFSGLGSTDNVHVASYTWTFLDGAPQLLTGSQPIYQFLNAGSFIVTLTVADEAGNTGTDTVTITVTADTEAPVAVAGPDRTVRLGHVVSLDGTLSTDDRGIVSYLWEFTDGTPVTRDGPYVTYVFATVGTYVVNLTVADAAGNTGTDSVTITVVDTSSPVAVAGPDQTVVEGTFVTFDGSASMADEPIIDYEWTFTDIEARRLSGPQTSYRFERPGVYVVTLTIRDINGRVGTDNATVIVEAIALVPYEHVPHRFRIGLPTGWEVRRDENTTDGTVDFLALGPAVGPGRVNIVITSEPAQAAVTDIYLLDQAQIVIDELPSTFGQVFVVETPHVVSTANTRAAVFTVCYGGSFVCQVIAVAADERAQRLWVIVGTAPASSLEEWRPTFNAVIRSFTVLYGSGTSGPFDFLVVLGVLALVGFLLAFIAIWLLLRRSSRPPRSPDHADTPPYPMPPSAPAPPTVMSEDHQPPQG